MGDGKGEPIIARGMGAPETVARVADSFMENVGRAIVNKEQEIRLCLVTLLCEGHLLIEDVPGVGKTLAALLEAMEERQVTIDGETHVLPKPFMVMATQNPVEYSGTFPLPEAQLDRFLMKVKLGYLTEKEEANLLTQHKVESPMDELQPVVSPNELKAAQTAVREVFVKPELREYIARLVGRTRGNPEVALGASTRGTLHLFHASQALAAIDGRSYVIPDDVKVLAEPVLAHRIILRPNAEMQGQSAGKLVAGLLEREHVPQMAYDG